jgi:hypothetical protein
VLSATGDASQWLARPSSMRIMVYGVAIDIDIDIR